MTRRSMSPALAALALALAACGGSPGKSSPVHAPAPPLRVVGDRVGGKPLLEPDAARAIVLGAGPLVLLGAEIVSEGERVGSFVEIPENECILAFARSSPSVADVDLFAYEDDGDPFSSDESPDANAAIVICPPHPRRLFIVARVAAGTGILGVGVQSVPRAAADAVAKAMTARGRPGDESGRLESWPGIDAKVREHRMGIGSRWEEVRRAVVPVDPRSPTRVTVTVEAGRCLDVFATPAEEVGSIELVAEDKNGRIVARGRDRGRDRTLLLCSALSADVTLAFRPRASQGLVAVVVGRSAVGAAAEVPDPTLLDEVTPTRDLAGVRALEDKALRARGYAAAKSVATGAAKVGDRVTVSLELPKGCARIDVIAGVPLASVSAELWDDKGALLADASGGAVAPLFSCSAGGAARVDVEALERPGPFAIELRMDPAAPPALVAHPIAAARLLARMNAGGDGASAADAANAQVVALLPATRRSIPFKVPANACASVVAAIDAGGMGIDLRIVDDASKDSTLSRSRFVTADRLCAGETPRSGSAELRLANGVADALVLVRTLASGR